MSEKTRNLSVFAPAKVNLHLAVLDRRHDGFHNLESLFLTVDFGDTLHFEPMEGENTLELAMEPPQEDDLPAEKNIIFKAVSLFREKSRSLGKMAGPHGLKIRVEKRIPIGGGLGGGSSDAAAALLALNSLAALPFSRDELLEMAAVLGSDVPFFLHETGAAWVTGRGENIRPLETPPWFLVLVNPGFQSDTSAAFSLLDKLRESLSAKHNKGLGARDWGLGSLFVDYAHWQQDLIANNDPQSPVPSPQSLFYNDFLPVFPEPQRSTYNKIISQLREQGAHYANLSGAGSTCFGIFPEREQAQKAVQFLRSEWGFVEWCKTINRSQCEYRSMYK